MKECINRSLAQAQQGGVPSMKALILGYLKVSLKQAVTHRYTHRHAKRTQTLERDKKHVIKKYYASHEASIDLISF